VFEDNFNDKYTKLFNTTTTKSVGLPISVQVVGFNFEDEKVLGVMKALESKIDHKVTVPEIKM